MRKIVKDIMEHIRKETQELTKDEYSIFLDQLKMELDTEQELSGWTDPDEE